MATGSLLLASHLSLSPLPPTLCPFSSFSSQRISQPRTLLSTDNRNRDVKMLAHVHNLLSCGLAVFAFVATANAGKSESVSTQRNSALGNQI